MTFPSKNDRVFWSVALSAIAIDVVSKALIMHYLDVHSSTSVIGNLVRFTVAYNPGAAFSMSLGDYSRYVFGAFALVALAIVFWLFRTTQRGDTWRLVSLGLIWGGAAGNLIDRIFRGPHGVVDFIDIGVGDTRFWTFNAADSAVTVGAILLALVLWREDRAIAAASAAAATSPPEADRSPAS